MVKAVNGDFKNKFLLAYKISFVNSNVNWKDDL